MAIRLESEEEESEEEGGESVMKTLGEVEADERFQEADGAGGGRP